MASNRYRAFEPPGRAPHPATVAQPKPALRGPAPKPPHPATVAQPKPVVRGPAPRPPHPARAPGRPLAHDSFKRSSERGGALQPATSTFVPSAFYGLIGHGQHPNAPPFTIPENSAVVFLQELGSGLNERLARSYWDHFAKIRRIDLGGRVSWPTHTYPPGSQCPEMLIDMHATRHPREGVYDLDDISGVPWNEREGQSPYRSEQEAFDHLWNDLMTPEVRRSIAQSQGHWESFREQCRDEYAEILDKIENRFDEVLDEDFDRVLHPGSRRKNLEALPLQLRLSEWVAGKSLAHANTEVITVVFACRPMAPEVRMRAEALEARSLGGAPGLLLAHFP